MKIEFSRQIFEKYSDFHENPVGAELFRADGRTDRQTDMTKQIVAFRNFANASNNVPFQRSLLSRVYARL